MKKLALSLVVILLLSLASVSYAADVNLTTLSDTELQELRTSIDKEIAARSPETSEGEGDVVGTLGDYSITIKGATLGQDYKKNPCIIVAYEWSHTKEEAKNFAFSFSTKAFQGGIELESATFIDGSVDSKPQLLDIRAGATLGVQKGYILRDETSPVEIEVGELMSFSNKDKVVKTFTLPL